MESRKSKLLILQLEPLVSSITSFCSIEQNASKFVKLYYEIGQAFILRVSGSDWNLDGES